MHPLFIAQYLLVPANTIVKQSLLPWMAVERGFHTLPGENLSDKMRAVKQKAETYLKSCLLMNLMEIVTKCGRGNNYKFENDENFLKF